MIKSPLRYPGGKSRALTQILPIVPKFKEFREPFVGGGSVFLALKQLYPDSIFWINDLYPALFKFWDCSQQHLAPLIEQIKIWKQQFTDGRILHRFLTDNISQFDNIKTAAAFFVFNRITFSGTTEAGGYSEQAYQKRFTDSSIERLALLSSLMPNTIITQGDYQILLEQDGKDVFIFLDPPYFSATKSALYGKNGQLHKNFDHERFAHNAKKCQHKWLITYDDSDYIRNLFSFAHITDWNLMYGMRNQTNTSEQLGKEIFIANFPLNTISQLNTASNRQQIGLFHDF